MPREQINHPPMLEPTKDNPAHPPGRTVWQDPILEINWHPDRDGSGHVQISLDMDVATLVEHIEISNGATRTAMYTPPLTRDEINKLIRTLRRARDQAYGQDA